MKASDLVTDSIKQADYIIVCPGDLYSSIIPTLLPDGVTQSIQESKAKIILILNIMTKKGETDNYTAIDFIEKIEKYLGKKSDYILYNNEPIPNDILLKYSLEQKVELGLLENSHDQRIISVPLAIVCESGQIFSNPKIIKETILGIIR